MSKKETATVRDVKVIDLKEKIEVVNNDKVTSSEVVEVYKYLLKDTPKEYTPTLSSIEELKNENKLEEAKNVAIQLKKIIVNIMFKNDTWAGKAYFEQALKLIQDIVKLDNKYLKKNLITDGEGWYTVIRPFTIDYTDDVILSRTAALATLAPNLELISFEDEVNWLLPNFDLQLAGENKALYTSLADSYLVNSITAKGKEEVKTEVKEESKQTSSFINSIFKKAEEKIDSIKSEVEAKKEEIKAKAESSSSSSSDDTWKTVAKVAGGVAAVAGAAFLGWKAYEHFNTEEVTSSNGVDGFNW